MSNCRKCGAELPRPTMRFCDACKRETANKSNKAWQDEQKAATAEATAVLAELLGISDRKPPSLSITAVNRMAREQGTSYGKMSARLERCG